MRKRYASLAALLCVPALLASCAKPSGDTAASSAVPVSSSAPVQTVSSSEVPGPEEILAEFSQKEVPGCRIDLPRPLRMTGQSTATSFAKWSAVDIDGNPVTEEVLRGSKVTLVSAWSTLCGSCIADLTALQEIYESYDRAQVNVIGIVASSQNEDGSVNLPEIGFVREVQEMTGASFLQLLPSDDLISIKLKEVDIVPETFLLDSEGNLIGETRIGEQTASQFREMIENALTELQQEDSK